MNSIPPGINGLIDNTAEDSKSRTYAILLSDTVVVAATQKSPEILTAGVPKDWQDIAYYLKV